MLKISMICEKENKNNNAMPEVVARRCSAKKTALKISQNSQNAETHVLESLSNDGAGLQASTLSKRDPSKGVLLRGLGNS